ncbi:MAG: DNA mismatch repair endonuclease MutL [Clostridia bacterium]|nr:DNA mismatch repair endonuclease MutL [Clostridia bacterium]
MPKIRVLPKEVAELIAAGEVVERPLSVVKELVENAIDAGADHITVEIKNGGVKYIRVTDNGCGISRADVPTAFISHATSKISTGDDLAAIFTLGFRGEALPSIAAVSRLSVLTRTPEEEEGTAFTVAGGAAAEVQSAGCPVGTTVVVRDLFYNTPARMKFLKKDVTEGNYVSDAVTKAALSHPEVKFSFLRDEKRVLSTPGSGDLKETVFAIYGKEVADALLACSYTLEDVSVEGYISRPLSNRPNRNMQYFFVNGRCVRIPATAPALDNAYKNSIMVGKFPMCFLHIRIDPKKTDVNVHPAKTEIRFSDDQKIYEAVFFAARAALAAGDRTRPEIKLRNPTDDLLRARISESDQLKISSLLDSPAAAAVVAEKQALPETFVFTEQKADINIAFEETAAAKKLTFRDPGAFRSDGKSALEASKSNGVTVDPFSRIETDRQKKSEPAQPDEIKTNGLPVTAADECRKDVKILGEVFHTYLIAEYDDRLLIIDKHAAHERIMYNKLIDSRGTPDVQQLLSPVRVTLSGREYAAVAQNLALLGKAGFETELFGASSVLVRSCPVQLTNTDVSALMAEIAGELAKGNVSPEPEKLAWLYESAACKAAVRAGDRLSPAEMQALVRQVLEDETLRYCPHGRPVMYTLSKNEIEKQFGRIT